MDALKLYKKKQTTSEGKMRKRYWIPIVLIVAVWLPWAILLGPAMLYQVYDHYFITPEERADMGKYLEFVPTPPTTTTCFQAGETDPANCVQPYIMP